MYFCISSIQHYTNSQIKNCSASNIITEGLIAQEYTMIELFRQFSLALYLLLTCNKIIALQHRFRMYNKCHIMHTHVHRKNRAYEKDMKRKKRSVYVTINCKLFQISPKENCLICKQLLFIMFVLVTPMATIRTTKSALIKVKTKNPQSCWLGLKGLYDLATLRKRNKDIYTWPPTTCSAL